ncbi:MAG: hypothetical protein IJ106_08610 [Parasporobacterium sp.]|nr:hypothetical protein [Parasporobacterium sp.]
MKYVRKHIQSIKKMVHSLDFILIARRNKDERDRLLTCLSSDSDCETVIGRNKLIFNHVSQEVIVTKKADKDLFSSKILDCRMSFDDLRRLLDGNYDDIKSFEWLRVIDE